MNGEGDRGKGKREKGKGFRVAGDQLHQGLWQFRIS